MCGVIIVIIDLSPQGQTAYYNLRVHVCGDIAGNHWRVSVDPMFAFKESILLEFLWHHPFTLSQCKYQHWCQELVFVLYRRVQHASVASCLAFH